MSISQIKKQFADFETYLGRDAEGLKRLKQLKDAVNELRTDMAAAVKAKELADNHAASARQRADDAELANQDLSTQVARLKHHITQLQFNLKQLSDSIPTDDEPADASATPPLRHDVVKPVIKQLRKALRYCPPPVSKIQDKDQVFNVYSREMFATGWQHHDMWVLGTSVALLASIYGQVGIRSAALPIFSQDEKGYFEFNKEGTQRSVYEWWDHHHVDRESIYFPLADHAAKSLGGRHLCNMDPIEDITHALLSDDHNII